MKLNMWYNMQQNTVPQVEPEQVFGGGMDPWSVNTNSEASGYKLEMLNLVSFGKHITLLHRRLLHYSLPSLLLYTVCGCIFSRLQSVIQQRHLHS